MQYFFELVKYFSTITQCFKKGWRAGRNNHKFLQVDTVIGMRTAVDRYSFVVQAITALLPVTNSDTVDVLVALAAAFATAE